MNALIHIHTHLFSNSQCTDDTLYWMIEGTMYVRFDVDGRIQNEQKKKIKETHTKQRTKKKNTTKITLCNELSASGEVV